MYSKLFLYHFIRINRDNVGVICVLQYKRKNDNESKESEGPKICISTTHLFFNPKQGAIKLAQLKILFEEVERLLQSFKGEHIPFILTGGMSLLI
jgi:protein angel